MTTIKKLLSIFAIILATTPTIATSKTTYGPYQADLIKVIHANEIEVLIYLWPNLQQQIRIKLANIYIPDIIHTQKKGRDVTICGELASQHAKPFVKRLLATHKNLTIDNLQKDRFGDYTGEIYIDGNNLSNILKESQLGIDPYSAAAHQWNACINETPTTPQQKIETYVF